MENQRLVIIQHHKGCILALTPEEYVRGLRRGKALKRRQTLRERLDCQTVGSLREDSYDRKDHTT